MKLYDISEWGKHGLELEDYPFLGEINIGVVDYKFGSTLNIENICYTVGIHDKKNGALGVRKTEINFSPEDCDYGNNIICPFCGYEDHDSWECADSDDKRECGNCGGIFGYERDVTVRYNSWPEKPPKSIIGEWIG